MMCNKAQRHRIRGKGEDGPLVRGIHYSMRSCKPEAGVCDHNGLPSLINGMQYSLRLTWVVFPQCGKC